MCRYRIPAVTNAQSCGAPRSTRWQSSSGGGSYVLHGQTPRCANYDKHSRSQPLGPTPLPGAFSWEAHTATQTQRGALTKDLALKEFNWPCIMKYLLSSFQVKYSGNLWAASDLCDCWVMLEETAATKQAQTVTKVVMCKNTSASVYSTEINLIKIALHLGVTYALGNAQWPLQPKRQRGEPRESWIWQVFQYIIHSFNTDRGLPKPGNFTHSLPGDSFLSLSLPLSQSPHSPF